LQEGYKADFTMAMAESLYDELVAKFRHLSTEVVIDDRLQMSIGQRLHYARSSGYPHAVILGKKVVESCSVTSAKQLRAKIQRTCLPK